LEIPTAKINPIDTAYLCKYNKKQCDGVSQTFHPPKSSQGISLFTNLDLVTFIGGNETLLFLASQWQIKPGVGAQSYKICISASHVPAFTK